MKNKITKTLGIIIDVLAVVFNLLMATMYVYALTQGYKPHELDMAWMGVLHGICINGAWTVKFVIIKITRFWKWLKSRKK